MSRRAAPVVLPFGAFYGRLDQRRHAPGLELAMLHADPHRVVERHSHEEAHFVLVLDGLYVSSASGASAISNGPLLVFNPAGTTHRDRFEARGTVFEGRFLTMSVSADLMSAAAAPGRMAETAVVVHHPRIIADAQRIARECVKWTGVSALAGESLALGLLSSVTQPNDPVARTPPVWLKVAEEMMRDRCGEDVRVADLARAAGVHPVHLARVFRHFLGCTPGTFMRRRRLERAHVLLRETRQSLAGIAMSCGFVDQSHFANAFKHDMGVTPGAYRRAIASSVRSAVGRPAV
jgi:AraC family transcriptional regulator